MSYRKDRDEFVAIMTQEGVSLDAIEHVLKLAIRYHRIQERFCNDDMPAATERLFRGDERRIEGAVTAFLEPFNVTPVFSSDPRGATIKLRVPSGRTNDWGNTGICVPVGR